MEAVDSGLDMLRRTHAAIAARNRYLFAGSTEGSYSAGLPPVEVP
jgi:hypothetical protein